MAHQSAVALLYPAVSFARVSSCNCGLVVRAGRRVLVVACWSSARLIDLWLNAFVLLMDLF
jgi:hypothetical protein